MSRVVRYAGIAAAVLFAVAVAGFGVALEGYLQSQYPVALLGAKGFPHALAFNLVAFVLPGMLAGVVAMDLRRRLPGDAGWPLRVGAQLVFVSALGFIAMGLLSLDPGDLESNASRYHGTAWMLWCVAFVPGACLLAAGLLRRPGWKWFARLSLLAALFVLVAAFMLTSVVAAGIAQRLAFGTWLGWLILAGWPRFAAAGKP
ncbi:MAG: DUF998 domain-containing protein [Pseudoxanthomonas sp.]